MSKSAAFPDMINPYSGCFNEIDDKAAVKQNLRLLLQSSKTELFGDPYFGTNLKRLIFEPNDVIIKDLVIDEIYTAIHLVMHEVTVQRENISISQKERGVIELSVKLVYNKDGSSDLLTIPLLSSEEM